MFEITTSTEVRVISVTNRIEKHGDEDVPAVSLSLEIETGNSILDLLDKTLRATLYKPVDDQVDLPEVEQVLPVLRCNAIDRVTIPTKHEGWTLNVDTTGDEDRTMAFGSCKVDKLSVEPKQGGTVVLRLRVGTSDLDAARSGMLGMHVGQPLWITLIAPRPGAAIDGSVDAFKADHPDAGDLFAERQGGPDDADSEGGEPDVEPAEAWPFPRHGEHADEAPPPQAVTVEQSQPGTRTARGRESTRRALAAVKYLCPQTLQTWSGRGLQPAWVKAAIAAGRQLSDFEVKTPATA